MAKEFPEGHRSGVHAHPRAQLLYCVTGVTEVSTARATWVVPPQRAVWLPAGMLHDMHCRSAASMRTIYLQKEAVPAGFPGDPAIVRISPLLRELILRAIEMPMLYDESGRDGMIADLLLMEFEWDTASQLQMQHPQDKRLIRVFTELLSNPSNDRTLDDWADYLNVSSRTLARIIKHETGTTFVLWRQQLRILSALPRLALGEPVINVALDVGYETPSAFSAMFRRLTGTTPARFFDT